MLCDWGRPSKDARVEPHRIEKCRTDYRCSNKKCRPCWWIMMIFPSSGPRCKWDWSEGLVFDLSDRVKGFLDLAWRWTSVYIMTG